MARFFIDRPVFAWVLALMVMIAGAMSVVSLPVAQYPEVAPPTISIDSTYPGASAKTVEDTVTQVIEQNMKGIDNLDYMKSTSDSSGRCTIELTFSSGTDPDIAQVQVQNKLQLATPSLPQEVQDQGISVTKAGHNFLLVLALISKDGSMNQADLTDYVSSNMQDPISRIPGVGDVTAFGSQYAMRIWLNPEKLQYYKLTPSDVVSAIQAQNVQVSAGQLGGLPSVSGQQINVTIQAQSRFTSPEQFKTILLTVQTDGSSVFLSDVARVELGSESYTTMSRYNGQPAAGLAMKMANGANALDTVDRINKKLDEMRPFLPDGCEIYNAFDTTPPIRISVYEVVKTLLEAIGLVFLVMLLFLQNFRATLIPTIAVPVVLLGTFAVLSIFGFSINTLTLFGMVLAIGLLVDDAIVVVENVERIMEEEHISPLEATRKSMDQISGALVGIALVLSAVFVPAAFLGGSTGVIYRQFSVTIVSAMVLSVLVALTLTPALCATMLKAPKDRGKADSGNPKSGFFGWFNRMFERNTKRYHSSVNYIVRRSGRLMLIYLLLAGVMVFMYTRIPTSYLPQEDQGILFTMVQLPANSTREQTLGVMQKVENYLMHNESESVRSIMTVLGFSFSGNGQNTGMGFVRLKDWEERPRPDQSASAIAGRCWQAFSSIKEGAVYVFQPPAIMELGNSTGFVFELQDKNNMGHEKLMQARGQMLGMAAQNAQLRNVRPNGLNDTTQFKISIDNRLAATMGLTLSTVSDDLGTALGGAYVNDFIDRGRVKKVYVQGDAPYRMMPKDLEHWHFRNANDKMVPFDTIAETHWTSGPARLERYNGEPSIEISGEPGAGVSSGTAMQIMQELSKKLPQGFGYDWTGISFQERLSGNQTTMLYSLSILVVFLSLAALYESWSVPIAVMLVVPIGVIGAVLAVTLRGLSNDVYFQIGILTTIGLASKNAILIVEFAKALHEHQGMSLLEAATEAAQLRLRPILMTSLAFGLGVVPLMLSSGAGSGGQHAVGTGVFGGTVVATLLGIFFIPTFFVVISRLFSKKNREETRKPAEPTTETPAE